MLAGFAGLAFVGYRRAKAGGEISARQFASPVGSKPSRHRENAHKPS
jgi:hypothetical protein